MSQSVLVLSPSHKCPIDFKVRGLLQRKVRTLASGELRVTLSGRSLPATLASPHAPLHVVVPRSCPVPRR